VTPLHISADEGHIGVVSLLIEHLENVDILGEHGQSPLGVASSRGHVEIGQLLLSHGADVNFRDIIHWTPLHDAAICGQLEFAQMLLEHGADPSACNASGASPSMYGNQQIVQLLSEYAAKSVKEEH